MLNRAIGSEAVLRVIARDARPDGEGLCDLEAHGVDPSPVRVRIVLFFSSEKKNGPAGTGPVYVEQYRVEV